jgi:hypothetical protein
VAVKKAQIGKAASFSVMFRYIYIYIFLLLKKSSPCVCAAKNHGFSIIVYFGTVGAVIDALPFQPFMHAT